VASFNLNSKILLKETRILPKFSPHILFSNIASEHHSDVKKNSIIQKLVKFISNLKEDAFWSNLHKKILLVTNSLIRNSKEGEVGKRGEELIFSSVLLVWLITIGGVNAIFVFLLRISSLVSVIKGLQLIIYSLSQLGEHASPFLPPVKGSELVTHGAYEEIRHPMYGGLVMLCAGLSSLLRDSDRLLLSLVLAVVLDRKANIEEKYLTELYKEVVFFSFGLEPFNIYYYYYYLLFSNMRNTASEPTR
jgi:protein-S-isoprenylcysteine O-methyltransferase Ste14